MSDVVTFSQTKLLVTGFGAFPGMPRNPSAQVIAALTRFQASFARRRIALTTQVLPVLYDIASTFTPKPAPDVIVHIGVAGRRRVVSIETRAHHRRSSRHPDASGRGPRLLRHGDAAQLGIDERWRARHFAMALKHAGVPAGVSRDAGAYVCNALLYRSLDLEMAPAIFIHIPPMRVCKPDRIARALARVLPDIVSRLMRDVRAREQVIERRPAPSGVSKYAVILDLGIGATGPAPGCRSGRASAP